MHFRLFTQLVLRHVASGTEFTSVTTGVDLRTWMPGDNIDLQLSLYLSTSAPLGQYKVGQNGLKNVAFCINHTIPTRILDVLFTYTHCFPHYSPFTHPESCEVSSLSPLV